MQLKSLKGFSLIEMLVANSIFSVVLIICVATIFSLNQASTSITTSRLIFEDINILLDTVTKEIRQGNSYGCIKNISALSASNKGIDCAVDYNTNNSGIGIEFISQEDTIYSQSGGNTIRTRFYLQNNKIIKHKIVVDSSTGNIVDNSAPIETISGNNIAVKNLYIYVEGAKTSQSPSNDYNQPRVYMRIVGNKKDNAGGLKDFDVYTSISQRDSE